jgi:hypothetical protein
MNIKIIKYTSLILTFFLWIQAYSPLVYKSSKLFPDDYRYGDLYHLSYLPQFKTPLKYCPFNKKKINNSSVNLFVIGDSFTEEERVKATDISSGKYTNVHWTKNAVIQLDCNKRNILILETVERTIKEHFSHEINNFTFSNATDSKKEAPKSLKKRIVEKLKEAILFIFPDKESIEQRFEYSLFSYDFFLKFRELKAVLNHKFFERIEKPVILSKDQSQIFFSEESDTDFFRSSFYPIRQTEIDTFVNQINDTNSKYLKAGFDEVYLSIIPNKVSMISPNLGIYNHLVERIQTDKRLQMPIINTYQEFKKSPTKYYLKSDTHWTCEGRDVWLEKVNNILLTP